MTDTLSYWLSVAPIPWSHAFGVLFMLALACLNIVIAPDLPTWWRRLAYAAAWFFILLAVVNAFMIGLLMSMERCAILWGGG